MLEEGEGGREGRREERMRKEGGGRKERSRAGGRKETGRR
jgi:hypothetical protein